jgi:hypothetical protein
MKPVDEGGLGLAGHPALSEPAASPPYAHCAIPEAPVLGLSLLGPSMFVGMVSLLGVLYGGTTRGLTPFRAAIIATNLLMDAAFIRFMTSRSTSPLPHCHAETGTSFFYTVFKMVIVYETLINVFHVIMHLPWPRRAVHSYHHELSDPVPVLGMYLHPVEQIGVNLVRLTAALLTGASAEVFFYYILGEKATIAIFHECSTALGAWHTRHHTSHDEVTWAANKLRTVMRRARTTMSGKPSA